MDGGEEYTDAVWVYWSKDLNRWDAKNKAVVLDGKNCTWSKKCLGMPSLVRVGKRLAIFYDAPGGFPASQARKRYETRSRTGVAGAAAVAAQTMINRS